MSNVSKSLVFALFFALGVLAQVRMGDLGTAHFATSTRAEEAGSGKTNNPIVSKMNDLGDEINKVQSQKKSEEKNTSAAKDTAFFSVLALVSAYCVIVPIGYLIFISKYQDINGVASRYYLVIVIVCTTMIVLVAGYTETQMAPVFGLLGSVLGYLFGRAESMTSDSQQKMGNNGALSVRSKS